MPVAIRLSRQGARNRPQYKIVVLDHTKKRDGQVLEQVGLYRPKVVNPKEKIKVDLDAVKRWQAKGAQVSQTVGQLIKKLAQ